MYTHTLISNHLGALSGRMESGVALLVSKNWMRSSLVFVILVICVLTACARDVVPQSAKIEDKEDLIKALRDAGAELAETSAETPANLEVVPEVLQVNSAIVYVYEYENVEARTAISDTLVVEETSIDSQSLLLPERINVWVSGRLIVAYPGTDGGTIMLLNGLLGDPLTQPSPSVDEPFPPAVAAALGFLADKLGVNPGDMDVVSFTAETWPDTCLGLPDEGEMCAQAETPGWRIMIGVQDQEFEVHSDQIGENLRYKSY
jgi:hypothetical protein